MQTILSAFLFPGCAGGLNKWGDWREKQKTLILQHVAALSGGYSQVGLRFVGAAPETPALHWRGRVMQ